MSDRTLIETVNIQIKLACFNVRILESFHLKRQKIIITIELVQFRTTLIN